ncbi:MAG: hypothetical protein KAS93_06725 [Gammaproteobacteria bacterium]|nr:hypothetical protein [Gammaproteobacteria bacterium]
MSETNSIAWINKQGKWLTHSKVDTHVGTKDHFGLTDNIEYAAIGLQIKDVPFDYDVTPIDVVVRRVVEVKIK